MPKKLIIPFLLGFFTGLFCVTPSRPTMALSGRVLISEIKLGGSSDPKEFVEIYNDTGNVVDLSTFSVEYAKIGFASTKCAETSWKAVASPTSQVNAVTLSGTLNPAGILVVPISLNDNSAGSLRLRSQTANTASVYDVVSWGDSAPCFAEQHNALPANGASLNRVFDIHGQPILSPNGNDFIVIAAPSPGSIPCVPDGCQDVPTDTPAVTYPALQITELLPDPGSPKSDNEDEYIELYNPNDFTVHLDGYSLFTASSTSAGVQSRGLNGFVLQPHEYKPLYSRDTGLGLVNSASGRAWLVAPDGMRVTESQWYPADMGENKAWALINGDWQITDSLTPGAENQMSQAMIPAATDNDSALTACPDGKYRNTETNRCKTLEAAPATLAACETGQERNPTTNRCRKAQSLTKTLLSCEPGQERNPETNRCRKLSGDEGGPAPCPTGYERNPNTNRCRKITAVKSATTNTPSDGPKNRAAINYFLMGTVSLLVAGYGIYEYRTDLRNVYERCKKRLKRRQREVIK